MSRIIGHMDLDYFYAQVEEVESPSLKGSPVVVCVFSGRTEESGVVSTANYKAREYGVRSGIPIALAKRRLEGTNATYVRMNHEKYEAYSDRVMETLRAEVDVLEQTGIDEAFFEITKRTGGDYRSAEALASRLKARILEEERLSCSVGIGPNKVVAKIASDFRKPDGLTIVKESEAKAFLSPMPITKISGVGPKTERLLEGLGVTTIQTLAAVPLQRLEDVLGKKLAVYLHNAANGMDDEPVVENNEATQLSRMITLKQDTDAVDQIVAELLPALNDLENKLVSRGLFFKNVSAIGIRKDLSLHTKSRTLETPTREFLVLEKEVRELFRTLVVETGTLRRAGVRVSGLENMVDQHSLTEFTS